ncbi:sensor histidine kinase [Jiangella mangrovi]|uniref:histidine kinase n=1 Tax=Jiangella mangrovi TaxID=1524084 RepID=A0A7W9GUI5_9ACTN|nr:sensor histidine kinase [Jiangella mangrovi]MBB5789976.1 signal transduction histidine kinase [Jiangella mangrovi]
MERLVRRLPTLSARTQDVLIAGFVTLLQVQGTHAAVVVQDEFDRPAATALGLAGNALLALGGLVLLVRRRWPVPVFLVTAAISVGYFWSGYPDGPGWLSLFVATYTLTAHGDGRRSLVVAANGLFVLFVCWILAADLEPGELGWLAFRIGATIMAAALGESVRSRRVIAADAVRRAEEAERTRDEVARRRVDAERLRIAREVHDTVAHAIAIINVQAGVTAHVLDKRPERARETLLTIEQTSARALREMRAILGVLRGDDDGPGPSLAALDELLAVARRAGLDVTVSGSVPAGALPEATDRAAYRIVQEAVTNVIRHAGPARVAVTLDLAPGELRVAVADDGGDLTAAQQGPPVEPGRGLAGMRERCELLGGAFEAGPDGAGFRVSARLPLERAEVAVR